MKTDLSKTVVIFVALTIVGVCLVVFGQGAVDNAIRMVLPLLGAAIFASGLTYLLLKIA